jgi:type I restriction enzyme S subunit
MSFPRYPAYKDSGVEWLGEVPGHWRAVPIKHLGRLKGGAGFPHEKQGIQGEELSFHKVNALAQANSDGFLIESENTIDRVTAKELGAFIFPAGSIVFAKVGAALLLGRIRLLSQNSCLDNNMMGLVIQQDEFAVKFVLYAMNLVRFDLIANPGAVPSLNEGQIGDFRLAMPPLPEQTQIAAFLDRETAKIDALVAEQRRLMALLKEKRQAVISHAVTRGLNPRAPLKPSGIEWLGDVPEHWTVTPVKAVCELFGRIGYRGYTTQDIVGEGEGAITLSPSNMANGVVSVDKCTYISWAKYVESPEIMIQTGDIVMVKTGSTFGKVAYVSELQHPTTINPQLVLFKNIKCISRFLFFVLNAEHIRALIDVNNTGSSIPTMTQEAIGNFGFGLPPNSEQQQIVEAINAELVRLDTLTTEAQRAIDLLQERRTALISAAVTGQIDVRGAA